MHRPGHSEHGGSGFTLIELLVVMAIVGILAAPLLSAVARSRAQAQSTVCKNHLKEMGVALTMYAGDAHHYPSLVERLQNTNVRAENQTWADAIYGYYPVSWTNRSWHCPRYLAQGGIIIPRPPMLDVFTSYAYNNRGMVGTRTPLALGLGTHPGSAAPEATVKAPGGMYAVADSRWWNYSTIQENRLAGKWDMSPWKYEYHLPDGRTVIHLETPPPHGQGYNVLFVDGHVNRVNRSDYLYPPRTAANWNRDNQPHPELWAAKDYWMVQN